jgi:lipid-binding SYLF domain-containing protein
MTITRRDAMAGFISATGLTLALAAPASAASASELIRSSDTALASLYSSQPKAKILGNRAKAILVFPNIIKAGFMVGAQTGNGVLFEDGLPTNYYNISAGSFGFQAGVQSFSYALFFMNSSALSYLSRSQGWSIGAGPSIVVLDKGAAKSITSTTLSQDVYAIPFGQQGLMAGMGLEGAKITSISVGP